MARGCGSATRASPAPAARPRGRCESFALRPPSCVLDRPRALAAFARRDVVGGQLLLLLVVNLCLVTRFRVLASATFVKVGVDVDVLAHAGDTVRGACRASSGLKRSRLLVGERRLSELHEHLVQ